MAVPLLYELPPEVIYRLLSWLRPCDVDQLVAAVPHLSPHAADSAYWRLRLLRLIQAPASSSASASSAGMAVSQPQYPAIASAAPGNGDCGAAAAAAPEETVDWRRQCAASEEFWRLWCSSDPRSHATCHTVTHTSPFCVDAMCIHPERRQLFIGSRDRQFSCVSIAEQLVNGSGEGGVMPLLFQNITIHTGWIWHICTEGDTLCTSCWDKSLRVFRLRDDGEPTLINEATFPASVLSSTFLDASTAAVACYKPLVYVVDIRVPGGHEGSDSVQTLGGSDPPSSRHRMPVLGLAHDAAYRPHSLYSASEDGYVFLWDLRNPATAVHRMKLANKKFAARIATHGPHLWCGSNTGSVYLCDVTNAERIVAVTEYDVGHSDHIRGLYADSTALISLSRRRLSLAHPSRPVVPLETPLTAPISQAAAGGFNTEHTLDYCSLAYAPTLNVLAAGTTKGPVKVFIPPSTNLR